MAKNVSLNMAKSAKQDEFYTQLKDIEKELVFYRQHFTDRSVLCNCDDPAISDFWKYFILNFDVLGLRQLVATHIERERNSCALITIPGETRMQRFSGDGDFRSAESVAYLKDADIVVTNPPFSLFREFVELLLEQEKKFLIIGNLNAAKYAEIFPHIMAGRIWFGVNGGDMAFRVPDWYEPRPTRFWIDETGQKWRSMGNTYWFTNLDYERRHEPLVLFRNYDPQAYPKLDGYDIINVNRVPDIPVDYSGIMAVPITFLNKHCPEQFKIIGLANHGSDSEWDLLKPVLNGRELYPRVLIQHKQGDVSQ